MINGRCLRGHDTSYPEARDSHRTCRKCKALDRNFTYDILYERTPERIYSNYKRGLKRRIKVQEERVNLLERILANAEEI